jgi:hypothetical protein
MIAHKRVWGRRIVAKAKTGLKKSSGKSDQNLLYVCAQPEPAPLVLPPDLLPEREFAIRIGAKKWVNGTVLHYHFLDRIGAPSWRWTESQRKIVRSAFGIWKALGIGLSFVEVADPTEAEIRIGCEQGAGSWSYVGTDNLKYSDLGRTMNFGWDLTTSWGKATALHELGHALGLSHEHQNPKAGIVWNETKVYQHFAAPPNGWDQTKTFNNILRKLSSSDAEGSSWDPASIMEYPFVPGLISAPKPYDMKGIGENVTLSAGDKDWVRRWYPATSAPAPIAVMQFERLDSTPGKQSDYEFRPDATRKYRIQTVGEADCLLVVFEVRDGEPRHFVAQDDSGADENLSMKVKMVKGRTYILRVRVNFVNSTQGVGLLIS